MATNWSTTSSSKKTSQVLEPKWHSKRPPFDNQSSQLNDSHCWASFLIPPEQRLQTATMLSGSGNPDISEISIDIVWYCGSWKSHLQLWDLSLWVMPLSDGSFHSVVFPMVHKGRMFLTIFPKPRLVILWLDPNLERLQLRLFGTTDLDHHERRTSA